MILPVGNLGSNTRQVAMIARKFIYYHHKLKEKAHRFSLQKDTTSSDAKLREAIRTQMLKALSINKQDAPAPKYSDKVKPTGAPTLTLVNRLDAYKHAGLLGAFKPKPNLEMEQEIERKFAEVRNQEEEERQELLDRMIPRILGLDIGSKFIGVAVSDRFGKKAQPLGVIHREIPTGERKFASMDKKVNGQYMRSTGWTDVTRPLSPQELGDRLKRYSDSFNVIGSVVGMPQDDSQGQIAVNEFITTQEYYGTFGLDSTVYVSEDYSTIEGRKLAYDANYRSGDDVKDNVDAFAAAVILQRFLDATQEEFAIRAQEYSELLKARRQKQIQAQPVEFDYDWDFTENQHMDKGVDMVNHEQDERDADYTYDSTRMAEEPELKYFQKKAIRKWSTQARKAFSNEIKSARHKKNEQKELAREQIQLDFNAFAHREELEQKAKFSANKKK